MRNLLLGFLVFISLSGYAQTRRNGPTAGIGVGLAISNHAGSYETQKDLQTVYQSHAGLRLLATQLKVGWIFFQSIMVNYSLKYTPPNDTVSPYSSTYHGGAITWFPISYPKWNFGIGAGRNKVKDTQGGLGDGILGEINIGYEVDPHFIIELNNMFGRMNNNLEPVRFPRRLTSNTEFYVQISANYLFYRKP